MASWLGQLLLCSWPTDFINSVTEKKLSNETVLVMILRRGFGKGGEEG